MHSPPSLRGGLRARVAGLFFGLLVCAVGVVCLLESRLGLSPWDVLHQGIARHTPLSFGLANVVVGLLVLAGAWALGARIGFGTVANAVFIGLFIQGLMAVPGLEHVASLDLPERAGVMLGGILCFGVGSAFYIGAALGAGPRDSLMLVLSRRSGVRVGAVRAGIELCALGGGFLLGGKVGVGTLAFALLVGPSFELSFWLLGRSPIAHATAQRRPRAAVRVRAAEQAAD